MGLLNVNLNIASIDEEKLDDYDDDDDDDDPEILIHVRFITWCNRSKQHKACKSKKIMLAAWHPIKW